MGPLLALLAQNGLSLLGNALLAKGKDVIEQKLGVDIEQAAQTPEGLIRLKELEIEYEQDLNDFVLATREQELKADAMAYADVADARKRDGIFTSLGKRNYRADVMFALAVAVVCWLTYIVWKSPELNEYAKGVFTLLLGRFTGYLDGIYNFEFGTTRNNRTKDVTIENMSRKP